MGRYETALGLMRRDSPDIDAVRRLLDDAITDGDARAAYALATWYLHGTHVKKSIKKGALLLQVAADHALPDALFDLAVLYERGRGVARNKAQAFALFKQAADGGDPEAMMEVGRMLFYGIGIAKDRKAADSWLAQAERAKAAARDDKRAFEVAV